MKTKAFTFMVLLFLFSCGPQKNKEDYITCHVINLNADIEVSVYGESLKKGDTIRVLMHEVGSRRWVLSSFVYGNDTTIWIKNSYTDRSRKQKYPPHYLHYAKAIVQ
jgi:hypothetical protein